MIFEEAQAALFLSIYENVYYPSFTLNLFL